MKFRMPWQIGCRGKSILITLVCAGFSLHPASVHAGEMAATSDALIRLDGEQGWNLGTRIHFDRRKFQAGEDALSLDIRQLFFRAGARPVPFLHVWGEAGIAQADFADEDGSAGLAWGIGAGASLVEYVIRQSPVFGRQESVALEIEAMYRVAQSDFEEDVELKWKDARIAPLFVYRINRLGDVIWRPYDPTAFTLRGGPVYARVTGDFGEDSVRETNDFGALFGVDVRLHSGWTSRFEATWFAGNDREITLGVHRYF